MNRKSLRVNKTLIVRKRSAESITFVPFQLFYGERGGGRRQRAKGGGWGGEEARVEWDGGRKGKARGRMQEGKGRQQQEAGEGTQEGREMRGEGAKGEQSGGGGNTRTACSGR